MHLPTLFFRCHISLRVSTRVIDRAETGGTRRIKRQKVHIMYALKHPACIKLLSVTLGKAWSIKCSHRPWLTQANHQLQLASTSRRVDKLDMTPLSQVPLHHRGA